VVSFGEELLGDVVVDFGGIGWLVTRRMMVVIRVLPAPGGREKTGNGRTGTRNRETADRRRLGDVEGRVVTLVHERVVVVMEKDGLTHSD
jgi:hypothetical protein